LANLFAYYLARVTILRSASSIQRSSFMLSEPFDLRGVTFSSRQLKGYVRAYDADSLGILFGDDERDVLERFEPGADETVIDVGAHIGKYSIVAALRVGSGGRVYALEPHPRNWEYLKMNLALNGLEQVIPLQVAAADFDGRGEMYEGSGSGWHSLNPILFDRMAATRKLVVDVRALDSLLAEVDLTKLTWMKIDVEGEEKRVVLGARNLIVKYHPHLLLEIHSVENFLWTVEELRNSGYGIEVVGGVPRQGRCHILCTYRGKR
jgi:FkbM family methyltransferase